MSGGHPLARSRSSTSPQTAADGRSRPVVVVTGASAGIGRATAVAFAKRGYDVGLLARGHDGLEGARREVEAAGAWALALPTDVSIPDEVFASADKIMAEWGRIDVWVNNAMATIFAPVESVHPDEFRRVTEVTYLGQVYGTMAALRSMRSNDHGTIVQVGSALSYRSIPLQAAYCGAKFAVRGFTDALRSELIHAGSRIRLAMVQLPAVNTPQFDWARSRLPRRLQPVPPIYQPEAIAQAIVRAAEEAPRELWVGWSAIRAILATMAVPAVLDRVAARAAWNGQMTCEPAPSHRRDNLFEPVPGDFGAHGRFDAASRSRVTARSALSVRAWVAGLAIAAAAAAIMAAKTIAQKREHRRDSSTRGVRSIRNNAE
jgi:short-subunit dehydrogenase